jgi:phage shock protein A
MADDELAKAVSLYDACAPSVTIEREYLTTLFAKQAQNLERLSPFLLQKEVSVSAKNIAKSWSETASLLALKNQILAKSLLIQKEFWQTEIKSNNGEITFNDRQEIFTRLNDSSRALDDKIRDIDAKIQVLQASEADYWQTYKVSARYSEQE